MKKLFSTVREDTCISCGKDKAIELYDRSNNPIRFSFILDTKRYILLDIRQIIYAKCRYCGKVFKLDWSNQDKIPRVLSDINLQLYIQQYSKSKIV